MDKKDLDFIEANKKYKLTLFGDADKDGVMNISDCKPFDKKRDGLFGRLVNVVTKGEHGQSKEDYEDERVRNKALRYHKRQEEASRRADLRRAEKEAYNKAFAQARVARASREGSTAGSKRWYDSFQNIGMSSSSGHGHRRSSVGLHPHKHSGGTRYAVVGGKAYPLHAHKKKRKSKSRRSSGGFFDVDNNFDIADNWGFFK